MAGLKNCGQCFSHYKSFQEAETLEQKQRLLVISQQVIKAADNEIEALRRRCFYDSPPQLRVP